MVGSQRTATVAVPTPPLERRDRGRRAKAANHARCQAGGGRTAAGNARFNAAAAGAAGAHPTTIPQQAFRNRRAPRFARRNVDRHPDHLLGSAEGTLAVQPDGLAVRGIVHRDFSGRLPATRDLVSTVRVLAVVSWSPPDESTTFLARPCALAVRRPPRGGRFVYVNPGPCRAGGHSPGGVRCWNALPGLHRARGSRADAADRHQRRLRGEPVPLTLYEFELPPRRTPRGNPMEVWIAMDDDGRRRSSSPRRAPRPAAFFSTRRSSARWRASGWPCRRSAARRPSSPPSRAGSPISAWPWSAWRSAAGEGRPPGRGWGSARQEPGSAPNPGDAHPRAERAGRSGRALPGRGGRRAGAAPRRLGPWRGPRLARRRRLPRRHAAGDEPLLRGLWRA